MALGAAHSANQGAASMVQALVDNLPEAAFVIASTHSRGDRSSLRRAGYELAVTSQRPVELLGVHLPLSVLAAGLRRARLPWRWVCRPAAMEAIAEADVVADISGISFVDGRRAAATVYNAALVAVPLLLGRPVVKCAQAMGPFRAPLNRRLARLVLPHLRTICPRGSVTEGHLREFGLDNLRPAADLAFVLGVPDAARARMAAVLAERGGPGPYLVVSPSQVVATYCASADIDYPGIMAAFIDAAVAGAGLRVVILAHACQPGAGATHLNDLPLCRTIHAAARRRAEVVLFDEALLPTELRAVIGLANVLVTSRLHAMVSALVESTPLLVIGWSHKYAEILEPFGLGDLVLGYDHLTDGTAVLDRTRDVLDRSDEIRARIAAHLPTARAAAEVNFDELRGALHPAGRPVRPGP